MRKNSFNQKEKEMLLHRSMLHFVDNCDILKEEHKEEEAGYAVFVTQTITDKDGDSAVMCSAKFGAKGSAISSMIDVFVRDEELRGILLSRLVSHLSERNKALLGILFKDE